MHFPVVLLLLGVSIQEPPKQDAAKQEEPITSFGTTVVDTAGFRGTVYHLSHRSQALPGALKKMKPQGVIYTRSLNVPPRDFKEGFPGVTKRFEWFGIDYEGKFWIERAGRYEFALTSDDGSVLYIDGDEVINNDGMHPPVTKKGSVQLAHGAHDIRVRYFQGPRFHVALILQVAPPGGALRVFSMDEFRPHAE